MNNQSKTITPSIILQVILVIVVISLLPLLVSRQWDWWEAWVYALLAIGGFAVSRLLAARKHPDLIHERAKTIQHENTEAWDKRLAPLSGLGGGLLPLIAGLDALFNWSPAFPLGWKIAALALILGGYALSSYALVENRFFSGVVRIQSERGHHVVSSGPYRWMRHPGYAGAMLTYLATPLLLDSYWAFLPAIFITIVLIIRTWLEDRTLQEKLVGYREYTRRVRYQLFPGIW